MAGKLQKQGLHHGDRPVNQPVGEVGDVDKTVKDGWRVCLLFWKAAIDRARQEETVSRMKVAALGCRCEVYRLNRRW
jgi:hypothetical protein